MGQLDECSTEVLESLLNRFLKPRHLARLYLTGCARLSQKLGDIPGRRFHLVPGMCSDLVRTVLLGRASFVTAPMHSVDVGSLARVFPMRIRSLHLSDYASRYTAHSAVGACSLDFERLVTLEHLRMSYPYEVKHPLRLPPSITSLALTSIVTANPVHEMEKLPLLTCIKFHICAAGDSSSRHAQFFAEVRWPSALTWLEINLHKPDATTFERMPRNLTHMTISRCRNATLDLAELTKHQSQLASLLVSEDDVTITARLPTTLREVRISGLRLAPGASLTETFDNIPPSVTRFSLSYIMDTRVITVPADWQEDMDVAFMRLAPRLSLADQEAVLRIAMMGVKTWTQQPPVRLQRFLQDLFGRHMLGAAHFSMLCADRGARHDYLNLSRIARLWCAGTTEDEVRRIVDGRTVYDASYHTYGEPENYVQATVCMLEWGYTRQLNLFRSERQGFSFVGYDLPSGAVRHLVELSVPVSSLDHLHDLLCRNVLSSVKRVRIYAQRKDPDGNISHVVEVLHTHKAHLPRLQTIELDGEWISGARTIGLSPRARAQLAEMRMYPKRDQKNAFSYYVGHKSILGADEAVASE